MCSSSSFILENCYVVCLDMRCSISVVGDRACRSHNEGFSQFTKRPHFLRKHTRGTELTMRPLLPPPPIYFRPFFTQYNEENMPILTTWFNCQCFSPRFYRESISWKGVSPLISIFLDRKFRFFISIHKFVSPFDPI